MTEDDLINLNKWFNNYTESFNSEDDEDRRNIILKVEHTQNVCRNIVEIAKGLSLEDIQTRTAEATALFHDIGRFPQYARYKTFRDIDSENHGKLGSGTLINEKVLNNLSEDERDLIINTVKFHNAYEIPSDLDSDTVYFLKLLRDADKVDIFRVFIEYYESPEEERASATAFGVPDIPDYSESMLSCVANGKLASYANIKTENDFRLMKLSWVYDMHFDESLRLLVKRDYMNRIIDLLPQTDEIKSAVAISKKYVFERLIND
jgi:hypothetical protein